jgi:EAL domain-containing protein (putative c-di-GMP-specific phosphodiesterase class I)/GGDEF domain-containing protein
MMTEPRPPPVDKSRCAQEPIHIPGSIQPHGLLLVLAADLTIGVVSENIAAMLGIPVTDALGAPLARVFGQAQSERLEIAIRRGETVSRLNPMRFLLPSGGEDVDFECVLHLSGASIVVELEPFVVPDDPDGLDPFAGVRTPVARMQTAPDISTLLKDAAADLRTISGFDRAMIYRFDEDWNGEVLAESTGGATTVAYLGLRFPATDIPEQARRLYLRNTLRLVVDVAYVPALLDPQVDAKTHLPTDLSGAILRSVSPVHLEYLRNMGLRATLTISIVIDGSLWGLIGDVLLQQADLALYQVKRRGGNGYKAFDGPDASAKTETLALEQRIDEGLRNGEFVPYFQPIVDLETGRLVALEALARWNHPDLGLLLPFRFIHVAEESDSIVTLGTFMLRAACEALVRWRRSPGREQLLVAVNFSTREFRKRGFLDIVLRTLDETGLPAGALQLEFTESTLIGDDGSIATLEALAKTGIGLSIDDFGTGYSSLSYLTRLPVDLIKIDRSLVGALSREPEGKAIVRAIIGLGHSLKLTVVAEGVETAEQLAVLRAENCDEIQGYLVAKPLSPSDVTRLVEHSDALADLRKGFPE